MLSELIDPPPTPCSSPPTSPPPLPNCIYLSLQMCSAHCSEEGAAFMATQYGDECWCSQDEELDFARHSESGGCDTSCYGNPVSLV